MKTKIYLIAILILITAVCFGQEREKNLLQAISDENFELAQQIVEDGANVNYVDSVGITVLMLTAYFENDENPSLLKYLINLKADILPKYKGRTVFLLTAYFGKTNMLEILISYKCDINETDNEGKTPLMLAVEGNYFLAVKILTLYGANIDLRNKDGKTALDIAKEKEYEDIISFLQNPIVDEFEMLELGRESKLLISRVEADNNLAHKTDESKRTLLHYGVIYSKTNLALSLIKAGSDINAQDSSGNTPLYYAVNNNDTVISKILIDNGADINIINRKNETSLLCAVLNGKNIITNQMFEKNADINGIINYKNDKGETLLHISVYWKNTELLNAILNSGIDINARDNTGSTALLKAIFCMNKEAAKILIDKGADVNIDDESGYTPYITANMRGYADLMQLLADKGADVNAKIKYKPDLTVQMGHREPVTSVCFSPDGKQILSGSLDATLKLWDAETGKEIKTYSGHSGSVTCVCFSPDGRQVLSGSDDKTLKLWDTETGKDIKTFPGHSDIVTSVCFSPDGSQILSGSSDKSIKLWSVETGKEIRTFSGHSGKVNSVCFSPSGSQILSGSSDETLKLWEVETGKVRTFSGDSSEVLSVCFSPDGRQILSGSDDNTLKLRDTETGEVIRPFRGDTKGVTSVCFSPDGSKILSGSGDIWETETGNKIKTIYDDVNSICFSHDGSQILSGGFDKTLKLWDTKTGNIIRTFSGYSEIINTVCFSHDGSQIIMGSGDNTLKLWNVETGKEIRTFSGHLKAVSSACFSRNGKQILSGSEDNNLKFWNAETGKEIRNISGYNGYASVCFSPGGGQTLLGGRWYDDSLKLVNTETGKEIKTFPVLGSAAACFSPDSSQILSGSSEGMLTLLSVKTVKEIRTFPGHSDAVTSVCFSPDGRQILSGSRDSTLKLWGVETGDEIKTFSGHSGFVTSVCFSPDGSQILSGSYDKTLKLLSVETGNIIRTFSGHNNIVTSVCFSPNGRQILSGSKDMTMKLWEAETGKELASLISFTTQDKNKKGSLIYDWAVVTPEGYWDASEGGRNLMQWTVGMETISLDQVGKNEIPGLLRRIMSGEKFYEKENKFNELRLPPVFALDTNLIQSENKINLAITNKGGGIGNVTVFINGKEWVITPEKGEYNPNAPAVNLTLDLKQSGLLIDGRVNSIEVTINNYDAVLPITSRGFVTEYKTQGDSVFTPPKLWCLAVGINSYRDAEILPLNFCVKDAEEFSKIMFTAGAELLMDSSNVNIRLLTSTASVDSLKPTKKNIIASLEYIKANAKTDDIILLYFSGHGINIAHDDFYYPTIDSKKEDFKDSAKIKSDAISGTDLLEYMRIPVNKQVVILDVCGGGGVMYKQYAGKRGDELSDREKVLRDMKTRGGLYILAGASKDKESFEHKSIGHGLLTYIILQYFNTAAVNSKGYIDVKKLFDYTVEETKKISIRLSLPVQDPVPIIPRNTKEFYIGLMKKSENKADLKVLQKSSFLDKTGRDNKYKIEPQFNSFLEKYFEEDSELIGKLIYIENSGKGYKISGLYEVDGENIKITYSVTDGEKELTPDDGITIEGKYSGLEKLMEEMIKKAVGLILKK